MNSFPRGTLLQRVVSSALLTTRPTTLRDKISSTVCLPDSASQGSSPSARTIGTQKISHVPAAQHANSQNGFIKRIFEKYNLFNISDSRLKRAGYILYESVADNIDYAKFITEFNMSDTFFSWFLITELHVWMLMVRTMAENQSGKIARNTMIEALWNDATTRAKVLWNENPGGVRKEIRELAEQFNYAIIGYDEGINGHDKVLAGAIWRRFFQLERNNPEDVEKLLIYIRKSIYYLDKLPREDVISKPNIKWPHLDDI